MLYLFLAAVLAFSAYLAVGIVLGTPEMIRDGRNVRQWRKAMAAGDWDRAREIAGRSRRGR